MKRAKNNDYDTEFAFDFEFDDYGPFSKTHPFRLYKYEKNENKKSTASGKSEEEIKKN